MNLHDTLSFDGVYAFTGTYWENEAVSWKEAL